ncbi:MAG: hypothetical protein MSC53_07685 [Arcanobacterium sp.]|nr:hypothetical protein [Arcanobacterium sp.]
MKKNVRAHLLAVSSLTLAVAFSPLAMAIPAAAAPNLMGGTSAAVRVVTADSVKTDLAQARQGDSGQAIPSEDDIAAAKGAEQRTQASIADIEVQLANLSAQSLQARQAADAAQEALAQAQAAAQKAAQEAEQAKQQADKAQKDVETARANMASIAQAIYQNSATDLTSAYYFFDADSLAEASAHDRAFSVVADSADAKVQSFKAMQDVATNLKKRADAKAAEQTRLMEAADVAADEAAAAAEAAQAEEAAVDVQRDDLLSQLATEKKTTKTLEAQRFQALEEQRIAREKAAAQARAQAEREQQAKAAAAAAAEKQRAAAQTNTESTPAPQASVSSPQPTSTKVDSSKPIIDVSAWQSPSLINYDALAKSVSGVIIRIGYTGTYSGSSLNKDSAFDRHYAEFTKRGVPVGAYWYSAANEGDEGANEARAALKFLGGRSLSFPIYIDVEDPTHQSWASMSALTDQSLKFASVVKAGGYRPGVYASSSWYYNKLNYSTLAGSGLSIWVAQWSSHRPGFSYGLWQYTDAARLSGYAGSLDANWLG